MTLIDLESWDAMGPFCQADFLRYARSVRPRTTKFGTETREGKWRVS